MKPTTDIVIRRAQASEWRALRDLRLRALGADPLAFGSTLAQELAFDEERWRRRASDGSGSATTSQWVAQDGSGSLVGSIVVAQVEGKVYVFGMWVEPRCRGRGIGARLLDTGLTWAGSAFPGSAVLLDVNPRQTAAVRLYESRGFHRSGEDRPLGHSPPETRFEMTLQRPTTARPTGDGQGL